MGAHDADTLYTEVWPDYFKVQAKYLWFYERLWTVLLRQLEKRTDKRWLVEFGSGPGFLLKLAMRRGWFAEGVEPSTVARKHATSIGAISWSSMMPASHYGAAIATEVLEHVDDPKAVLSEWRETIASGGLLALSVPNDNNPLQRLFGRWISPGRKTSKHWIHPTHCSYFNRKSLREVVELAGFEVVWEGASFPVEILLAIPFLSRKWAWKLSRLWPAPPLLWRFGIGRHCLLLARKKEA